MAINPIQQNINNIKVHKPYIQAEGPVDTKDNTKPLAPEGHLVHDYLTHKPKYILKDTAYDIKALKDGFDGNANDHQLGRLNNVGLKLGGVGIATILAARTKDPKVRVMEYAGLGAFLASMSLYPKLAINAPSRIVHGFDIGKEYIDDQGRKKSVFQDSNYIPFDMYQGDFPGEDLDIIGDRMGIPRNIKNRNDLVKEQMRKIATQNETLWMLTAASVPVFSAIICSGLEKAVAPVIENVRNSGYNATITNLLKKTQNMNEDVSTISHNKLSQNVEKILTDYKGKELPKADFDNLVNILTKDMDYIAAEGIKADLENILTHSGKNEFSVNDKLAQEIVNSIKANIPSRNSKVLEKVFVPSVEEIENILKQNASGLLTDDGVQKIKSDIKQLFDSKIANETSVPKEALNAYRNDVIEQISKEIKKTPSRGVTENNIKDVVDFAKVIGDFKQNKKALDKCKSFKFEYAPETVIARSYGEFEKTLVNVLGLTHKDLKQMRHSSKLTQEILDKKLSELAKDNARFEKGISKLTKVISDMEIKLHGKNEQTSHIQDLTTGIENNYNKTAIRLNKIGKFQNTIDKLVKEDVSTLSNSLSSRQDVFDMLDGLSQNKYAGKDYWNDLDANGRIDYAKYNSKGVGSSKNLEISRMVDRYQGSKNSFNRILHLFDLYKRPIPEGEFDKAILAKGKEALLTGTSSEHTLKLNMTNNPEFYKDVVRRIWSQDIQEGTQKGLDISKDIANGDVSGRFKKYIQRFQDVMGNNNIDFTKPQHFLDYNATEKYTKPSMTRMSKFNLVAQNSVDLLKNAAERRYASQKWMRIASTIGLGVLGVVLSAQFAFGKIRHPHNIQMKEGNNANK